MTDKQRILECVRALPEDVTWSQILDAVRRLATESSADEELLPEHLELTELPRLDGDGP